MERILLLLITLFISVKVSALTSFTVGANLDGQTIVTNTSTDDWSKWQVEYGPVGFEAGTGTLVTDITTTSKVLVLDPFVSYDFRIQNGNFNGYVFFWSDMYTLVNCVGSESQSYYTHNFDTSPVSDCWKGYSNPANYSDITIVNQTDIYHGFGSSGGAIKITNSNSAGKAMLVAPKFNDISGDKEVSFWVRGYTGSVLKVGTLTNPYDTATFNELETIPVQANWYSWYKVTASLDGYNGSDEYIAIQFEYSISQASTIYIDDFIYQTPCDEVTDFSLSNIGENSVQLNFNASEGQSLWQASVYNPQTFGTVLVDVTSNPFTVPNLVGEVSYQVKMRAICGENDYSDWTNTIDFTTVCENVTAGYFTSFGDLFVLQACWDSQSPISALGIETKESLHVNEVDILLPKSGTKLIEIDNNFTGLAPLYLISPYIADLDTDKRIRFFLASRSNGLYYNASPLVIGTVASPGDMSTFQEVQTITPQEMNEMKLIESGDYWKEHTVYFNNYTIPDNHHYIVFKHASLDYTNALFIDHFNYETIPSCTEPLYPVMVTNSWDNVTVGWQNFEDSSATEWQIEYGEEGFTAGTGTIVTVTSNPATLSGLPDDTKFDFYIRSKCGSIYSNWSDRGHFNTRCAEVTVGYSQNFDDDILSLEAINSCWSRLAPVINQHYWRPARFITTVTSGTPLNYPAHSGTRSIMHYNAVNAPDTFVSDKAILVTPRLADLDNTKLLSFWMYSLASDVGSPTEITVGTLSDPDDYTTFTPFYTITDAALNENQWKQYVINFSTYTGTDQYVGIRQAAVNSHQILFFDDFVYSEAGCTTPAFLTAAQTAENAITLGWNSNNQLNPPTQWEIEYGAYGFQPGTGTVIPAPTNPFTIENLFGMNSEFEFRVRNICTEGIGDWSEKYAFKVTCSVSAPFYEGFDQYDGNANIPEGFCWTQNDFYISRVKTYNVAELTSAPNSLELNTNSTEGSGMIISPYLSDFDSNKKIKFFAYRNSEHSNSDLIVGTVSNVMDLTTFEPYATIELDDSAFPGKQYELDFSGYTGNASHIAFLHSATENYGYIYLDDIYYMDGTSNCPEPLNAFPYNINSNAALITWDASINAESYELEYGPFGFTPGTGTVLSVEGHEKLITGLAPQTQYEFYIKSVCGEDESSIVVGPQPFTTTCVETAVPWVENLDALQEYGENAVPDCFKVVYTEGFTTMDTPVTNQTYYDNDNTMTGVGDTTYIHLDSGFATTMITPVFSLTAGTTYSFSLSARKAYEFSFFDIQVSTGRGNNLQAMDIGLITDSQIHEYQYNEQIYYFTPLVSGEYSYKMDFVNSGGLNAIIDKFQLKEGYTSIISDDEPVYDFENGLDEDLILEGTDNAAIGLFEDVDSTTVIMEGGNEETIWLDGPGSGDRRPATGDKWQDNSGFVTKINMKVDASAMENLTLNFDLKQTFAADGEDSSFRVVINGEAYGEVLFPETADSDSFVNHSYDLTAYVGGDIYISLQHIGKSRAGSGDTAYVDNIAFAFETLDRPYEEFAEFKLYPNPVTDDLVLQNSENISKVEIFDVTGQQLLSQSYEAAFVKINMADYSSGVYFIKATCSGKQKTFKVIKE